MLSKILCDMPARLCTCVPRLPLPSMVSSESEDRSCECPAARVGFSSGSSFRVLGPTCA